MNDSRQAHIRGWLLTALVANCAAAVLGFAEDWLGEPLWLDIIRAVLAATAIVCLAVYIIRSVRRRTAKDSGAQGIGE